MRQGKLYDINLGDDHRHYTEVGMALDHICSKRWYIQDRSGMHVLVMTDGDVERDHYLVRETTYGEWSKRHPKFGTDLGYERKPAPEVGDLVTVELAMPGHPFPLRQGARIVRVIGGNPTHYLVKLVGLRVERPYEIGMQLPLSADKVIDWE